MAANDIDFLSSGDLSSVPSTFGSLLFLHHSDHHGLLLVSKRLNGDNYNSWHRAMKISLSGKNKTYFITGKIKEPHEASNPEEHALWQRYNDMVLSWILNSLELELADFVLSCNTPYAIWEDLCERFSLGNAPRIFQVQRDIYRIERGQMSVSAYYIKLKALWTSLYLSIQKHVPVVRRLIGPNLFSFSWDLTSHIQVQGVRFY